LRGKLYFFVFFLAGFVVLPFVAVFGLQAILLSFRGYELIATPLLAPAGVFVKQNRAESGVPRA
jgi:hypothetical protein